VPTYEYACGSCDAHHEIVQKMTDPTLTDCPDCGQPTLRKLFNGVGVVFKGSGFYRTDSRSSEKSVTGSGDKGSSSSSSESTSTSTKPSEKSSDSSSKSTSTSSSGNSSSSSSPAKKSTTST
jgi:putative FmdB family regulatory protein